MNLNKLLPQILLGYVDNKGCALSTNECNELTKYVSGLELEISRLTAANKWVSVKDALPECKKSVFIILLPKLTY